jgi:hypothetical protein
MDRSKFFAAVRKRASGVFGTSLSQSQVDGINGILDEAGKRGTSLQCLAYILATAFHESAHTMQPVRETLASTDDKAISILEKSWKAGKLPWVKSPYWRKDSDGKSWLGRGLVQITHKDNYAKFGLTADPSQAMQMATAIRVIFDGMEKGMFTGKKLSDYIGAGKCDYEGARRIVNGTDKAKAIARYASAFEKALNEAAYAEPIPVSAPPVRPAPPATIQPQPVASGDWLSALISAIATVFTRKAA